MYYIDVYVHVLTNRKEMRMRITPTMLTLRKLAVPADRDDFKQNIRVRSLTGLSYFSQMSLFV